MTAFPELLVLRHGETGWNREGRMQGSLDSELTELGQAQARMQNAILRRAGVAGFDWFVSPRGRTVQTARIASEGLGAELNIEPRLAEIDMGLWTGRLHDEIAAEAPELFDPAAPLAFYHAIPGGERLPEVHDRLAAFLAELRRPAVVVTHGIASRLLRCIALGLPWQAFETLEGGQGVVYRVRAGRSERLVEENADKGGI
ncbi:histidine phosphatase family protein [Seohaeicola zhoushanensis]|uniref:Phosphoglycerate mutase n=1 Tax=Seohaeicola zhoushanensis TaxID=1569283 RepID=A0A8J3GYN0_9RHOB|nr:histidine phosphatase family protein [Seohaeicola zhoushanensis]GHF53413.1 phosphoglycerate mutase [Seohaeicola zhoushanensis]